MTGRHSSVLRGREHVRMGTIDITENKGKGTPCSRSPFSRGGPGRGAGRSGGVTSHLPPLRVVSLACVYREHVRVDRS
eukprot:scaffold65448_cov64-Phaeocystis_antarctica.AAC.3